MAKAKWIRELVGENFLAVYDVVADIHKERQLVGDTVDIPYFQDVVKFPALLPADSSSLRDRYCQLRWKAVKLLERHGAVTAVSLAEGDHRWGSIIRVTVRDTRFSDVVETVEHELARLSQQAPAVANGADSNEPSVQSPQPLQPLLLPERITLRWLASHVPVSFWLWLAGTYLVLFALGVKFGDQPMLRRAVGESELQRSAVDPEQAAVASAADVTFLPGDVELGLPSVESGSAPARVEILANIEKGTATLTRHAEILRQEFDSSYILTENVQPKATIISVVPDRSIIRASQDGAKIIVEFDRRSIIPRGAVAGGMSQGEKVRIGTIQLRLYFSVGGRSYNTDVELPVFLEPKPGA